MKFTKIIATIGPACDSEKKLKHLYKEGMNVARLNFSHGDFKYFRDVIKKIRSVSQNIPILLDTKGPEVRTGDFEPFEVKRNEKVIFTHKKISSEHKIIFVNYKNFVRDVQEKDTILIDDGKVRFKVNKKQKNFLLCTVLNKAIVSPHKSVDIPWREIKLPDITKKDIEDLKFGMRNDVDIIALSLIKKASTVKKVRKILKKRKTMIISKIEHPDAVDNFDEILKVSDGIMIARGDLGLNLPPEEVPSIQKDIIKKCNACAKPVIVATQMLESMTVNPRPTRAESSDVANAIYDGADAVMLSGETAGGNYPVESVMMMRKICEISEKHYDKHIENVESKESIPESISLIVNELVKKLNIKAIIAPTSSGFTTRLMAKYRPKVPIVILTHDKKVMRQMGLIRGVFQFESSLCDTKSEMSTNKLITESIKDTFYNKLVKLNDLVLIVYNNSEKVKTTNAIQIREVKEFLN
jgi:pyruvate kinase